MPSLSKILKAPCIDKIGCLQLPLLQPVKEQKTAGKTSQELMTNAEEAEKIRQQAQAELLLARQQCEQILAAAAAKKEALLAQGQAEAATLRQEAQEAGFQRGYREGLQAGEQESRQLRQAAEEMLAEARQLRQQMLDNEEPKVVKLAVEIAEKFVRAQRLENPQILQQLVQENLQQIKESGEIVIRLHPEDAAGSRELLPQWQAEVGEQSRLHLLADSTLQRGDCCLESSSTVLSCRLDERFAALRQLLAEVMPDV